ncbi:MAG: hypothetical protein MPL62_12910, partial [Alphaproteobacteria bacterium]|nr:hypothetical protein [Alphaproteobacteria bacterium]
MKHQKSLFLKLTLALSVLLMAGVSTTARAQGTSHAWFNPAGDTTTDVTAAPTTYDIGLSAPAGSDTNFTLELMGKVTSSGGDGIDQIALEIQYDSSKVGLQATPAENIRTATSAQPDNSGPFAGTTLTAFTAAGLGTPVDDNNADTDSILYPGWVHATEDFLVEGEVTHLATINFVWKTNAEGNSPLNIQMNASSLAFAANTPGGVSLTLTGPPVAQRANLTLAFGTDGAGAGLPNDHKASAERATQEQGNAGTSIEVTCNLIDAQGAAENVPAAVTGGTDCSIVGTAAVLGGAAGSATHASAPSSDTEYAGDDVTTAMVVNIPAGSSSGTATFEINSNSDDATLQFDFRISAVEDHTATGTDLVSDQFNNAGVTFRIVNAALQLVALGTDGACSASNGAVVASSPIEEGGDAVQLCVTAVSDPGGTGIAYACTLPDADASGIQITGGTGTLTDGTSRTNGNLISFSLPDDTFAGGGGSTSTVTCAVTDTGGSTSYSTSTMTTVGLAVTDPDVVTGGSLAATATISEKAGPAPIVVTASITGAISPGGDCTVDVTVETTTDTDAPADTVVAAGGSTANDPTGTGGYVGTLTIPDITIAGRSRSGTSEVTDTVAGATTSGAGVLVPHEDNNSMREHIRFSGTSASCGGATNLDFGNAYTLIVDKTGGDSLKNLNYSVLPVATQFGLASAMNNIQTRATASRSGSDRQAVFSLSGDTTTESVLMTHMKGAAALDDANDYEYDWKKAFSNSS